MYGMNIGYLNAIRSKNNIESLSEIPIYKNPSVFNMTFKNKKWNEIHQFAIHCVHCIQQAESNTKQTKIYHSMHDLEEHFLNKHYLDYQYKCIYDGCYCICLSFEQLIEHITIHYNSYKPFYCFCNDDKICCYKSAKQKDLIQHIESFHFIKVIRDKSEQSESLSDTSEIIQEKRNNNNNNEYKKQTKKCAEINKISNGIIGLKFGLKMQKRKENVNKQRKQQQVLTQKLLTKSMNQYRLTQQLINEKIAADKHQQEKRYKLLQKLANVNNDHENMFGYKSKKQLKHRNIKIVNKTITEKQQRTRTVYRNIMKCKVNGMKIKQVNGSLKAIKIINNKHNKENVNHQDDRYKSMSSSLATTPTINGSLSPRHHQQNLNLFTNKYKYPYPAFANNKVPEIVDVDVDEDEEIPDLIEMENDSTNAKQHANQKNKSKKQQHKNNNNSNNRNRNRNGLPFCRPAGIPRLLPDTSQFKDIKPEFRKNIGRESKYLPFSLNNPHSIIFPYFMSCPMIPMQATELIAESGCYDDCIPPLLIPIVPAAFQAALHSPGVRYDQYLGNPIKKPFYKSHDNTSWKLDEPLDPHYKYHKTEWFPPKKYCHPQNLRKSIKITEKFHFCKEKVYRHCKINKHWYKIDGGASYVKHKKESKIKRKLDKKRIYNENMKRWNRRRKNRRKRYKKRNKIKKELETDIKTCRLSGYDLLLRAAQNAKGTDDNFTDCTTCSDYDSSSTNQQNNEQDCITNK